LPFFYDLLVQTTVLFENTRSPKFIHFYLSALYPETMGTAVNERTYGAANIGLNCQLENW